MARIENAEVRKSSQLYDGWFVYDEAGAQIAKIANIPGKGPHLFFECQFGSYAELKQELKSLLEQLPN